MNDLRGFDEDQQKEHEKQSIESFGQAAKLSIEDSNQDVKNWSQSDWERSMNEFSEICQAFSAAIEKKLSVDSKEVQNITKNHYLWLKKIWTPTKHSYSTYGRYIVDSDLIDSYITFHPQLPQFISQAIQVFSENELS